MMTLIRVVVVFLALCLLGGCAQEKQTAAPAVLNSVCVMTGEPIDASSPTSDYMGGKVAFCCEKCQAKWAKLDDAGKQAALAKHKK